MLLNASSPFAARIGGRLLAAALVAVAVIGGLLVLEAPHMASAQEPECEITDLGTLGGETQQLEANGRWTTEDCDSAFRAGSDAHSYSFQVEEGGRVRIDLLSSEADSYLYLLSDAGDRIADNDDGAAGVNARIERDLEPGAYRIEATTVGGRGRGPADFSLTVGYAEGCETIPLGVLTAEADLTATGVWTVDTCGSRIEANHPAYSYSFMLPASGRVRIDLMSEHGDPVLSLASPAGVIGANDDGGPGRNSRIEKYLLAGVYLIEATTYLQADRQPLVADFELTVHLVDEVAIADYAWNLQVEPELLEALWAAGNGAVVSAFSDLVERIVVNQTNPDPALGDNRSEYLDGQNPHPFLSFQPIRQAMSMAIDRERLTELYGFAGRPECDLIAGPEHYVSGANDECLTQDIAGANRLLDEHGVVDSDGDGVREHNGVPLRITYQTSTNAIRQATQELVRDWWREIGIETELVHHDAGVFFGSDLGPETYRRFFADVQMYATGGGIEPQNYLSDNRCTHIPTRDNSWSEGNVARACDPEYDAAFEQLPPLPIGA